MATLETVLEHDRAGVVQQVIDLLHCRLAGQAVRAKMEAAREAARAAARAAAWEAAREAARAAAWEAARERLVEALT